MATGPWESFKPQQDKASEPQEQGPWAQFAEQKPAESGPWAQFAKSEPKPEEQSAWRQVADLPLKGVGGVVTGVRMVADAFGAGSGVSNTIKGAEGWIADLYSAQSKQDSKEVARIMKDAEDKGVGEQLAAAVKAFSVAPVDMLVSALGTSAPLIAATMATVASGGTALAATGVRIGLGATMGAGATKGAIYESVKEELGKTDMSEKQIEDRAQLAQDYNGKNLDQILMGTAIGGISGVTGFEASVARQMGKKIASDVAVKTATREATEEAAKRGMTKHGAITAAKESGTEFVQGGHEQAAENIALQREGYDVPTTRGVVGQGALEGLAGAGMGAVAGAREAVTARNELVGEARIKAATEPATPEAQPEAPEAVAPAEERVKVLSDKLQSQGGFSPDDADTTARMMVAEQDKASPVAAEGEVTADPVRVAALTEEFISSGYAPALAQEAAQEVATREARDDALAEAEAKGGADVARTDSTPIGDSAGVAVGPDTGVPAEGVGAPERLGVAPTGQAVEPTMAGEAAQPTALAPAPAPVAEAPVAEAPVAEAPVAEKPTAQLFEETKALEAQQQVLLTKAGRKPATNSPARAKWDALDAQIEESKAAWAQQDKVERDATTTQPTQEADVASPAEPAATAEGQVPTAEATAADVVEAKLKEARTLGRSSAHTALDQQADYDSLDEAIESYRDNVGDTLDGQGLRKDPAFDYLLTAAYRAFDEGVQKLRAPATEAPRKRGRPTLSPEDKAVAEAKAAQQRIDYNKQQRTAGVDTTAVEKAEQRFADAIAPIDDDSIDTEEALKTAQQKKRVAKVQSIRELVLLQDKLKGTPLAARVDYALGHAQIKPQEIADVKKGIALTKASRAERGSKAGQPDAGFSGVTNGAQAISRILKTGNAFQKMLAQRIRGALSNVKVVVLEQGQALPEQLEIYADTWDRARGLYVYDQTTGSRTVYLRGVSFGADQGVNNVTVLHELLHAATNQKLMLGMTADAQEHSASGSLLSRATRALSVVMDNASQEYAALDRLGLVSPELREIVESTLEIEDGVASYTIFSLPQEFLAHGMTDEVVQDFLMNIDATLGRQTKTLMDSFVEAIMKFFGLGNDQFNAMTDLVLVTHRILHARKTPTMRQIERMEQGEDYRTAFATAKSKTRKVTAMEKKLEKSNFADALKDGGILEQLTKARSLKEATGTLAIVGGAMKLEARQQLLPTLMTSAVAGWAEKLGINHVRQSQELISDMAAMKNMLTNAMNSVATRLSDLHTKSPEQYKKLGNVMHYSSLVYKDPSSDTSSKVLNELWSELTPESKVLYAEVRDFYIARHKLYFSLLDAQINDSKVAGSRGDESSSKGKLLAQIKKVYEDGTKLYPYFPLMRYGQYWARVGKGKAGEFHMFEGVMARELFVAERIKQLKAGGDTRTKSEMFEDMDIETGNDMSGARKQMSDSSTLLKEIINTIDAGTRTSGVTDDFGNAVGDRVTVDAEALKDSVIQMFLQSLPDRNFRRQFIKRQGKAGFSGDIHRNFITSGTNTANQLARIKYGAKILGELEQAQDSLAGDPEKSTKGELITELRKRAEMDIRPDPDNTLGHAAANFLNKSAFLWMMTSIKTAAVQLTALPIFVVPVLISKHGAKRTTAALGRSLNVFNSLGVTAKDGSYTMPTMATSKGVLANADEQLAAQYMIDRGISDTTMAYDLGNRRDIPTAKFTNRASRMLRATTNGMTAMFHHIERLLREVTFMTSYRLYREGDKTHAESLRLAENETHQALGDYRKQERPRGIGATAGHKVMLDAHKPLGRTVLQFKMYPAFVTTYFVRNFFNMTKGETPEVRKQARVQFIGSLMTSFALAGYAGLPGISMAMGILQTVLNGLRGDDDDDPLEGRNLEMWFRKIWMPNTFGNVKIGGMTLDELFDKGAISALTGYDITSSMSMNNMWFPERKGEANTTEAMEGFILSMMGPGASLGATQVPKAIDYFNEGKIMRGMEQLAPALLRGPLTAARFGTEGATTAPGGIIKDADEFTLGQLLAQGAGFTTTGLQMRREDIFRVQGEILKVTRERTEIMNRLELEISTGTDTGVERAFESVFKFNQRNPVSAIEGDHIKQSLKKQMERRYKTIDGFPIDKKFMPQVLDLLEPSSRALEREFKKP